MPSPIAIITTKLPVATLNIKESNYTPYFNAIGELEAHRQVLLASELSGLVTSIWFKSGNSVMSDQLLVQLNDAPEQGELIKLQGQLSSARLKFHRMSSLVKSHAVSKQTADDAQADYETALGEVDNIKAKIRQKQIHAPFSGEVGIRRIHLGQYINAGDPVATLADVLHLHVNFTLAEKQSRYIRVGQKVEIEVDALKGRWLPGRVNAVDPIVETSHTVLVQAQLQNQDQILRPGMYAHVRLLLPTTQVIWVPETAIVPSSYGDNVFVVVEHPNAAPTVKRVRVETGEHQGSCVIIQSGLKIGQRVVTSGQLKLQDNSDVYFVKDSLDARETR